MSAIVWSPEHGWHDGAAATLAVDEHGRIRSEVQTLEGVALRADRDVIGWMSDWGAPYALGWITRGLVETVEHNSGGLGGFSYRLTAAGQAALS